MSKYITLTAENFEANVEKANKPVIVDFWAAWCGPCKMLSPVFEQLSEELGDKVIFGKINVDEQEQLAMRFKVMSIPTLIVFKDGKAAAKSVGVISANDIKALIENA